MGLLLDEKRLKKIGKLEKKINVLPRVRLAKLPTPLEKMSRLGKELNLDNLFIKRDDLTGLAFGGNKTRMFEFTLAKIQKENKDCIVGTLPVQSNYARQLSAACAKLGIEVYLVLHKVRGTMDEELQGNYLIDFLCGANIDLVKAGPWKDYDKKVLELAESLKKEGKAPYILGLTNKEDSWLHAVAYVNCGIELFKQLDKKDIIPDYIFLTSSNWTQAGILVAARFLDLDIKIIGISPITKKYYPGYSKSDIFDIATETYEKLGLGPCPLKEEEIVSLENYVGEGYGSVTDEGIEAIKMVARLEGIMLDPVYTGKGFSGLIDFARKERLRTENRVIFLHTGGAPSLFAYFRVFSKS